MCYKDEAVWLGYACEMIAFHGYDRYLLHASYETEDRSSIEIG